jgi:hypothetical protein
VPLSVCKNLQSVGPAFLPTTMFWVCVCLCVYVCVCERERERERESVCVCFQNARSGVYFPKRASSTFSDDGQEEGTVRRQDDAAVRTYLSILKIITIIRIQSCFFESYFVLSHTV